MATRIYAVQAPNSFHLVEAGSKNAALRHIARNLIQVDIANQKTLVAAMRDGVTVEVAGAEETSADSAAE